MPEAGDIAAKLWEVPMVVLAHATEQDPIFFYANRAALALFEVAAQQIIRMPSRLSAEPVEQADRARFMARVTKYNFIADYSGVRISQGGRRFRIERATVWNLIDLQGRMHGQAACFDEWTPLDTIGD